MDSLIDVFRVNEETVKLAMKKMKSGGFKCYKCDKTCRTEKGFNNQKCSNL